MSALSIIIINYNTYSLTCDCIQSIYGANFIKDDLEIILVDNGSSEITPQSFKEIFPEIIIIRSEKNLGFAKGNNLGISKATKPYILLLNSDTLIIDPNTFSQCINKLNEFDNKIILTTKLLTKNGQTQVAYGYLPSLFYEFLFTSFLYKLLPQKEKERSLIKFLPDESRLIKRGYITATFYLFKRDLLSTLSSSRLYDETFLYGEELFWATQAIDAGFQMYYHAGVSILHLIGASSKNEIGYTTKTRRTYQIQGEHKYLLWRYNKLIVSFIYMLRILRFILLSIFDSNIRMRLAITLKVLLS